MTSGEGPFHWQHGMNMHIDEGAEGREHSGRTPAQDGSADVHRTHLAESIKPATDPETTVEIRLDSVVSEQRTLSSEFLHESQACLLASLDSMKADWDDLGKEERATRLIDFCNTIDTHARVVMTALVNYLENLPDIDTASLATQDPEHVKAALQEHAAEEQLVADALAELQLARFLLVQEVYRNGRNEFSTSTGLIDDMPKVSAWTTTALGAASLATAVTVALYSHHAIHEAVHHAVEAVFGHNLFSQVVFYPALATTMFLEGIPVLASSVVGPYLFGLTKTLGGRAARFLSSERSEEFTEQSRIATELNDKIHESRETIDELCNEPARYLTEFFKINNDLRQAASTVIAKLESDGEVVDDSLAEELHDLNWQLGVNETVEIVRFLNLRRGLKSMDSLDVRSQELREEAPEREGIAVAERERGVWPNIKHTMATAWRSCMKVVKSSDDVGARRALEMTEHLHSQFEALPRNILADPFSGLGSGISSTLHMAFETGERPERALLDALKGGIGAYKNIVVGGIQEGPTAETIFDVVFEMDELKSGRKLRWGFKFAPTFVLLLVKKPALLLKAEKKEEAKGTLSPNLLEKEMAERQGRTHSSWKAAKEVCKITGQAISGTLRGLFVTIPLRIGSRFETTAPVLKNVAPFCMSQLEASKERQHKAVEKKVAQFESKSRTGNLYRQMSDPELEVAVVREFLEYQYGGEDSLSQTDMIDLLSYWQNRRKLRFLESDKRKIEHEKELLTESPLLTGLREACHYKPGIFAKFGELRKALLSSNNQSQETQPKTQSKREPRVPKKLIEFVEKFNDSRERQSQSRTAGTILAGTADGLIVYQNGDGKLELLSGIQARRRLIGDWQAARATRDTDDDSVRILPHAYEARLATAMAIVAAPIEAPARKALIDAHLKMKGSAARLTDVAKDLIAAGFTRRQLFGKNAPDDSATPGLFRIGLIGDKVPTDAQLHSVTRELSKSQPDQ